ncbi:MULTISPECIES: flagellar hook-length control protein FliK [Sulfitobacter]|uniref:flagellar hook-length control protein FliK n=1 Tax=Sulfitobacter TaxID=60136 RepID=UPI000E898F4E|nr:MULTISPECIES: flagellar hook-length control protein FliK [Sulfitobacter]HAR83023.1 flagellar hook-length control protein FliK [Sulfitobacter pontiacus]HBR40771.1 flagellar hook-length control protein FliK [Sulfitobacter pontiacus]|tara:strand:- start:8313 stop:9761 length:1449 start_codon:yes stop_codon:yes gene_type:complete
MNVALSALMTGQAGVKTGKGSSAVPEGFAALMGTVAIGEAGAAVPPFTLGPDGEPILLGSDDTTPEAMADVLGLSPTTEQAGDPTALSMEASFTGLMSAAQPTGEGATAQATGAVTTATTVSAPAVAVPQTFVQGVAGDADPQLPLAAPSLAADAVAANVTQTAVKVAPETAAPTVLSPVEAKTDVKIAAPAPQASVVPQSVAAPATAVAAQQPIAATAEVQSVAQTQVVAGVQPVPKPQVSDKVSTPPRAAPQAAAAVEGTAPPEPSIDADTPVAPLRQAAFGAEQPTFLNAGQNGAATQGKAPVDVTATFRPAEVVQAQPVESNALILADQASDLKAAAPSAETQAKPAPKPFADALISQVKAVEAKEGRTSVSLHPRGLGQIEIEVVTDKDSGTRVVVRVENPAVLQTLRDERQLLAQGLGFTDAGSFEFQQGFSDEGARDQHRSAAGFGGGIDDGAGPVTAGVQHKNVVDDGQLDILT